jgi:hypothetical protein
MCSPVRLDGGVMVEAVQMGIAASNKKPTKQEESWSYGNMVWYGIMISQQPKQERPDVFTSAP